MRRKESSLWSVCKKNMSLNCKYFREGQRLTMEDYNTLETGTLVFWKGVLLEFYKKSPFGAFQVLLRESRTKLPAGSVMITSLKIATLKLEEDEQEESYDYYLHWDNE